MSLVHNHKPRAGNNFLVIPRFLYLWPKSIEMKQRIAQVTLLVKEYDEAIQFYTEKLGFLLVEDTRLSEEKRWVIISPQGATETRLLLAKATNEEQMKSVGHQAGGRVFLFLFTDDFWSDYHRMVEKGVNFVREPQSHAYGQVAVFEDLYGNLWDFIEPSTKA